MMALWVALAWADPCPAPTEEGMLQFALEFHGHRIGGNAIVSFSEDAFAMVALSAAGNEIFSIQEGTVRSAFPEWVPWLERLPFERDIRLGLTPTEENCELSFGKIVHKPALEGWQRTFKGKGGKIRAVRAGQRIVAKDRRRGYTLTMVLPHAP